MRKLAGVVMLLIAVSGCAINNTAKPEKVETQDGIYYGWKDQAMLPAKTAYFALLEKAGNSWDVKLISKQPIQGRDNDKQEILFVDKQYRYIQPWFQSFPQHGHDGSWECSLYYKNKDYSPCNSQLTSVDAGASLGKNIAAAILTFGLAAGSHQYIDRSKVAEAVKQSDLINKIKSKFPANAEEKDVSVVPAQETITYEKVKEKPVNNGGLNGKSRRNFPTSFR